MPRRRAWLRWMLMAIGLPVVAIVGMLLLMSVRRPVVHPNPQAIPSAMQTQPSPQWSGAVDRARQIVRTAFAEQNLPGLSVAVGAGGEVAWAEGFGWADIKTGAPITPNTRFRIGTASSLLTSAGVGLLLDGGKLALDDEIQKYVPQFPKKPWPVTLRQLMAHMGGVITDTGDDGPLFLQRCEQPVQALQHFAGDALLFEPGTQYRHSKYGWILVSAAVESASTQPFLSFMREQIFKPLRMDHTGAESATEENPDKIGEPAEDPPIATFIHDVILVPLGVADNTRPPASSPATIYSPGMGPHASFRYGLHPMRLKNLSCYAGSMAFLSTPSDLARFGLAMHNGTLIKPATVRLLQTSPLLKSGQETGHGLDWDLHPVTLAGKPVQAAGHDGEFMGRKVMSLRMFGETGIVVAVMSSLESADTSSLALKIAEAFAQPASK